jgi:site-specific recombinase XerD
MKISRRLPLNVVRRLAGHRELSTTQTYLSLRSEDAFEAVNVL